MSADPWNIIGWFVLSAIVLGVAALVVSWELERRKAKPAAKPKALPLCYRSTRNIRPRKERIYVHGRTFRGDYLLSFQPHYPPWVEAESKWRQRVEREGLELVN